jgi:hypothetical protein
VANNTDGVGMILASSILLREERELLRGRETAPAHAAEVPQAAAAKAALANDAKAVEALLFTLLDEQLDAAEVKKAASSGGNQTQTTTDATDRDATARLQTRYAEIGVGSNDADRPNPTALPNANFVADARIQAAPELQSFLQRLAAAAAGATGRDGSSQGSKAANRARQSSAVLPIVGGAVATLMLIAIGVFAVGWLFS